MFGNSDDDSDDSTEYEYAVVDERGQEVRNSPFDSRDEAAEAREEADSESLFTSYSIEQREVETENEEEDSGFRSRVQNLLGGGEAVEDDEPDYDPVDTDAHGTDVSRFSLGNHDRKVGIDPDQLRDEAAAVEGVNDDLADVLQSAASMIGSQSGASNFECPRCGINHGHRDSKHDVRDLLNVDEAFAERLEFVPFCHCGVNELAMLMDYIGYLPYPIFDDEEQFGTAPEMDNDVLVTVFNLLRQYENDPDEENLSVEEALEQTGYELPEEFEIDELENLYYRWNSVKDGADSAPIGSDTRREIEEYRQEIERTLGGDE